MNKLKLLISAGLIIYTLFYLIQSSTIITYPYQVSYPEGLILNQIKLLLEGKPIYKSINDYPLIVTNYPPVYLLLCAGFVKLFGLSFIWGRLITFLATIFVVFMIYKILHQKTQKEIAIISALLFISSSYIYKDTPFMRVDMLGLLCSLLGFYIFLRVDLKNSTLYSIPFFILSLYTKQTFISAPIAIAISLLFRLRKRALIFILLMIISYLFIFFIINQSTHGEFFRHNILYNFNIFDLKQAFKFYIRFLQNHAILFFFSVLFILDTFRKKEFSFWSVYFIIAAINGFSVGKVGANTNYFFELIALNCILAGLSIERLKNYIDEKKYPLFINGALLTQLILFLHMPFYSEPAITKTDWRNFAQLSQVILNTDGKIISEDAGIIVVNKKQVLFQPFELTQLANQKLWNQDKFVNDIKNRRFSLLVFSFNVNCSFDKERLTSEMADAIKENYYIERIIGDYFLYKPLSTP
ncbi:MAG: glycosyltransferase family 39 protein [candidate division WOR-3 bacterium]